MNGPTMANLRQWVALFWKEKSVLSGKRAVNSLENKNSEQSLWDKPSQTQTSFRFPGVCFALCYSCYVITDLTLEIYFTF